VERNDFIGPLEEYPGLKLAQRENTKFWRAVKEMDKLRDALYAKYTKKKK
jgi:hypothetical protein